MGELIHGSNEALNGDEGKYVVKVTMDRGTLAVNVDTEIKDIDTIINMLSTAMRYLDVQYRIAAGIKAQEQWKQRQQEMQVAAAMMARRVHDISGAQ